jgi:hypothetical protein
MLLSESIFWYSSRILDCGLAGISRRIEEKREEAQVEEPEGLEELDNTDMVSVRRTEEETEKELEEELEE